MTDSVRTAGRHRTDAPQGTAYDIVCQHRGTVWVTPDHHRHCADVVGDLADNRDMAVSS